MAKNNVILLIFALAYSALPVSLQAMEETPQPKVSKRKPETPLLPLRDRTNPTQTAPASPYKHTQALACLTRGLRTLRASRQNVHDEETEQPTSDKTQPEGQAARPQELQGIFTRNPARLQNAIQQAEGSPARRAIREEATSMTPYLTWMYQQQYESADPNVVSPLTQASKNKRKKTKHVSKDEVRAHRTLFQHQENWSATIEAPYSYTIHQRDELFDLLLVDPEGRLNLHRAQVGLAPLGHDKKPINLHHVLREDPGPLAEISADFHARESGPLHPPSRGIENRVNFNDFRQMYWQARAYDWIETYLP